ncbi:MAG: LemA family protein [Candidatus Woesearchaeota archaeon]
MDPIYIILIIIGVLALFVIILYNGLIRLRNQVRNSWSQIDVQLKRRNDMIPNLIKTVKGYAKHEKELLTTLTKERTAMMKTSDMKKKAQHSDKLSDALKSVFAVSESYPDLKANQNFLQLQEEISGTENKIAYARQHYNDMVLRFNTKIEQFPANMIANSLGFSKREYFKTPEEQRKNVEVSF